MKEKPTVSDRLRDLRFFSGEPTLEEVSKETGISTTALSTYENDELKDIPHTSIIALAEYYHVSADYLLGLTENQEEGMTELRELSVNDEFVCLLKSREIHNELLCEFCTHPAFRDFLSDLEIYVDGMAGISIQTMNVIVDTIQNTIMRKIGEEPELREDQQTLRMLEAAIVDEDEYFLQRLSKSLGVIARNLREKHKKDPESVDYDLIAKEYNRKIREAEKLRQSRGDKGALLEILLASFAEQIQYPISKITREEKEVLRGLFERSGAVKNGARMISRGRRRRKK